MPSADELKRTIAALVSAQKPSTGLDGQVYFPLSLQYAILQRLSPEQLHRDN